MKKETNEESMRQFFTFAIYLIGLGVALVAYAHANFASKSTVEKLDDRVYQIWQHTVPADQRAQISNQN